MEKKFDREYFNLKQREFNARHKKLKMCITCKGKTDGRSKQCEKCLREKAQDAREKRIEETGNK